MGEISPSKYTVECGWDDVPHLSDQDKAEILASTQPYLRSARSTGRPGLGVGAIYPIEWEVISCDPFPIPHFWPRCYSLDVGWNLTAALWAAWDRDVDTVYLYAEHYRAHAEPSVHAAAIKARGDWIPGVIDPASRGRSQRDGKQLRADYTNLGLNLVDANNAIEAGIQATWERLAEGRLKVLSHLQYFASEYRLYRRQKNEKTGKVEIVKAHDHQMDNMRYICAPTTETKDRMSGLQRAIVKPVKQVFGGAGARVGDASVGY